MTRFLTATLLLLGATLGISAQAAAPACTTISLSNGTPSNTLPSATAGTSYSQTFTASGSAAAPFGYQITSGLPAGLGLSIVPSTGVLSGTPTQAGGAESDALVMPAATSSIQMMPTVFCASLPP